MSETSMRDTMRKRLTETQPSIHWQRIEGYTTTGVPDINFCLNGTEVWIEAKQVDNWPKRATTLVKVGLRPEQKIWLRERVKAGGKCFVIAKIERDWLVFKLVPWYVESQLQQLYDGLPSIELVQLSSLMFRHAFDAEKFLNFMQR